MKEKNSTRIVTFHRRYYVTQNIEDDYVIAGGQQYELLMIIIYQVE